MFEDWFVQAAIILSLCALFGATAVWLRPPLIAAFIVVGVLVGPSVLGIVSAHSPVGLLASLGISVLLFVVGLKLDLHLIKTTGPVAVATGVGQVVVTSVLGYLIVRALGSPPLESLYAAVALKGAAMIGIVAFVAGVSLASTPYRDAIGARLTSLRDFLLVFFSLNSDQHWTGPPLADKWRPP